MNLAERVRFLSRLYTPELPEPVMVCSLVFNRTLDDGRYEFKCSHCGNTQITTELLGTIETKVCHG
jgi:hypothetical protein